MTTTPISKEKVLKILLNSYVLDEDTCELFEPIECSDDQIMFVTYQTDDNGERLDLNKFSINEDGSLSYLKCLSLDGHEMRDTYTVLNYRNLLNDI